MKPNDEKTTVRLPSADRDPNQKEEVLRLRKQSKLDLPFPMFANNYKNILLAQPEFKLARIYYYGLNVKKNPAKAEFLFYLAVSKHPVMSKISDIDDPFVQEIVPTLLFEKSPEEIAERFKDHKRSRLPVVQLYDRYQTDEKLTKKLIELLKDDDDVAYYAAVRENLYREEISESEKKKFELFKSKDYPSLSRDPKSRLYSIFFDSPEPSDNAMRLFPFACLTHACFEFDDLTCDPEVDDSDNICVDSSTKEKIEKSREKLERVANFFVSLPVDYLRVQRFHYDVYFERHALSNMFRSLPHELSKKLYEILLMCDYATFHIDEFDKKFDIDADKLLLIDLEASFNWGF